MKWLEKSTDYPLGGLICDRIMGNSLQTMVEVSEAIMKITFCLQKHLACQA